MQMEKLERKGGRGRGSSFHMSLKPNAKRKAAQRNNQALSYLLSLHLFYSFRISVIIIRAVMPAHISIQPPLLLRL